MPALENNILTIPRAIDGPKVIDIVSDPGAWHGLENAGR
jgi:hypothetical protein